MEVDSIVNNKPIWHLNSLNITSLGHVLGTHNYKMKFWNIFYVDVTKAAGGNIIQ